MVLKKNIYANLFLFTVSMKYRLSPRFWVFGIHGFLFLTGIVFSVWGDTLPSDRRVTHPAPKPLVLVSPDSPRTDENIRLRIVTYNDFHGSFREKNISIGAAKFVTALDQYKDAYPKDYPTAVGVLSVGDNFSGTALSYYSMYEMRTDKGNKACPLENFFIRTGTLLSCIGNHEFDWEPNFFADHLSRSTVRLGRRRFHVYSSSNVTMKETALPPGGIPSYDMLEIPEIGFKIAVLTLTTMETPQKTTEGATADYLFEKPAEAAKRLLPRIPNADAVLFVAHLSSYQDADGNVTFGRETEDMLELVRLKPMAIISAHSHRFVSGQVEDVPIIQAGCYANGLASLNFIIDPATKKIELESRETIDLRPRRESLHPDPVMEKIVADAQTLCDFTRIGTVREDMPSDRRRLTDIGVLISKAVATTFRDKTGEEPVLGFQHSGGIRSNFSKGDITQEDCYDMLPFQGGETLCRLSGDEIVRLMREGFVNPVGYLQSFGLTFHYDKSDAPKQDFMKITFRHRDREIPIEPDKKYWAVIDSFIVAGGDGFSTDIFEGNVVVPKGPQSRDVLIRYCRNDLNGDIGIDEKDRLKFVVESKE